MTGRDFTEHDDAPVSTNEPTPGVEGGVGAFAGAAVAGSVGVDLALIGGQVSWPASERYGDVGGGSSVGLVGVAGHAEGEQRPVTSSGVV